ncbi:MAG: hypothetical protein J5588_06320 [Bacteroidales bacterium]|nr:hypothetical protein [Bacteroidales bacterium]MBP5372429.1 hypothetical protein [Bacteroidales bacterium]
MKNLSRKDRENDIPGKDTLYSECITKTVTAVQESYGYVTFTTDIIPERALVFINGALNRDNYSLNTPANGTITFEDINEGDEIVIVY